jgi:hypothetical protein
MNPSESRFIRFVKWNEQTSVWEHVEALADVQITDNRIIDLYWDGLLESEGTYMIIFAPYTVKDQIRVPDGNEFLGKACMFQVKDHKKPEVVAFEYETDGCSRGMNDENYFPSDLPTDVKLSIVFDEAVQAGSGVLIIRRENGSSSRSLMLHR